MRGLIILCLVALACADKLGYDYQPDAHPDDGISLTSGLTDDDASLLLQTLETAQQKTLSQTASAPAPAPEQVEFSAEFDKEFYSYSAPEEAFDDNEASEKISSAVKKNLRVVFLKAPENKGFEEAALKLAKQAADQRTAVYVLSKQSDIGALASKFQNLRSQTEGKPEVNFIKYRTAEDAANAERTIKEQYNTLPGTSRSEKGGEASVLNFASRAPVSSGYIPPGPGHQYLPADPLPSLRRFRFRL